jgi:uncharacterized protein YkwD
MVTPRGVLPGRQGTIVHFMRAVLLLAVVVAALVVGSGAAASRQSAPWGAYLAPVSACPTAADGSASVVTQQRAMACLINWTRRQIGVRQLAWSPRLATAADVKAQVVIQCSDFSHYPCGRRWPTGAASARRAWNVFGENLYVGNLWLRTPRAAMLAWLLSPEHRSVLFGRAWTRLGVSVRRASELAGGSDMSLWVLEVAGRR